MKISIIGTGNVAYHLANAFYKSDVEIHQIYGRNKTEAEELAAQYNATAITDINLLDVVSIIIIAISDDAIKSVAKTLPETVKNDSIVAHTSGTKPISVLKGCENKAIFYPLQTFSKDTALDFSTIPICLNGKQKTIKKLHSLGKKISDDIRQLSDEERRQVHLSAVILNNFINHLIYLAKDRLDHQEIDSTILDPLLRETLRKQFLNSPYDAQTGPARREDIKTMDKHLEMLEGDQNLKEIYIALSESIVKSYL